MNVARDICNRLEGSLISIASVIGKTEIRVEADKIGIVFPCYLAQIFGLPLIIERFANKLVNASDKYIFAVCTYGGFGPVNAIPAIHSLKKTLSSQGVKLSIGFSLRLPLNNLDYEHIPIPINRDQNRMFRKCNKKTAKICTVVEKNKSDRSIIKCNAYRIITNLLHRVLGKYVLEALKKNAKESPLSNLGFRELIPLTDKSIHVNDKCNGCGVCSRICPVRNIKIEERKPEWQHRCEMCLACDEWCPQEAIHHWCKIEGKNYHHPKIGINDMIMQSKP